MTLQEALGVGDEAVRLVRSERDKLREEIAEWKYRTESWMFVCGFEAVLIGVMAWIIWRA